jgi:hypothetical protein
MMLRSDPSPASNTERVLAIFSILVGAALSATIFGQVAQMIDSISSERTSFKNLLATTMRRMEYVALRLIGRGDWKADCDACCVAFSYDFCVSVIPAI